MVAHTEFDGTSCGRRRKHKNTIKVLSLVLRALSPPAFLYILLSRRQTFFHFHYSGLEYQFSRVLKLFESFSLTLAAFRSFHSFSVQSCNLAIFNVLVFLFDLGAFLMLE